MAKNGLATLYDDNGLPIASTATGKGSAIFGALCVSDNGVAIQTTTGGTTTTSIAAAFASDTTVKAAPGRLCRVLVTATGTNPMLIFDNASGHTGTVIGALPASPAVGTTYDFNMPAANGITVQGSATNPGVTISFI